MEHLNECPICKQAGTSDYLTCKDYTASKEKFNLVKCNACHFIFTNPRPLLNEVGRYYQVENYISHSGTSKGFINKLYHQARKYTLAKKLRLINKLSSQGNLLDIGCGTGNFLAYAMNNGWNVTGVEPDDATRAEANKLCKNKVYTETKLNEIAPSTFNVITMWHVLEHVYNLDERVAQIKRLLKPNGTLIVAVPNCASYDAAYYQEYWGAYDVPRHLYHFKPENIVQLFEKQGFKLTKMLPMNLDSFYVSMLSEKYKGSFLPRAIIVGFLSNLNSMLKKGTSSSQIYILQLN